MALPERGGPGKTVRGENNTEPLSLREPIKLNKTDERVEKNNQGTRGSFSCYPPPPKQGKSEEFA